MRRVTPVHANLLRLHAQRASQLPSFRGRPRLPPWLLLAVGKRRMISRHFSECLKLVGLVSIAPQMIGTRCRLDRQTGNWIGPSDMSTSFTRPRHATPWRMSAVAEQLLDGPAGDETQRPIQCVANLDVGIDPQCLIHRGTDIVGRE